MPPASKRKKANSKSPQKRQPAPAAEESGSDAEDQNEPQAGPSSRSRMPPPPAAPKRKGYRCKLCRKAFYDFNEFNRHKRVIHQIAASVITVAPDQVSLTSEDAPSLDGDEDNEESPFPMPSEAAPVQRKSVRTADARTAVRDAAVDPARVPRNARTKNQLPPAFNDKERAQSKENVRVPKFRGV